MSLAGIPPNSLFSAFAFLGFLLAGLPLPWHMYSWHMGTCMYMLWTSLGCLILFVNSIVWNDNVANSVPVWCDISARYLVGASVGIPASSLCIIRRLYHLTKLEMIAVTKEEKRRGIMVDLSIGVGLPCVVMALQYVVQDHRFIIYEQLGCYPFIGNTIAAYFLIFIWPLLIGLISIGYAVPTFRRAFQQKQKLKNILHAGFFISAGRYWRLMALCCVEIICTVPLSIYVIVMNTIMGVVPYVSWSWTHWGFSRVDQYPTDLWKSVRIVAMSVESLRWFYILCAFLIFAFFGWAQEARVFYRQTFLSVYRRLWYSKASSFDGANERMRAKHSSPPAQVLVKRYSLRTPLEFEAPPRPGSSLSSGLRRSVDETPFEDTPRLSSLSDLARYTKISWESLIAVPEPALSRDRRQSLRDASQLV